MKTVLKYKGYTVKEITKRDGLEDWRLGELRVFDRDGNEEYEAGSIDEAKEQIDGLLFDHNLPSNPKVTPEQLYKQGWRGMNDWALAWIAKDLNDSSRKFKLEAEGRWLYLLMDGTKIAYKDNSGH